MELKEFKRKNLLSLEDVTPANINRFTGPYTKEEFDKLPKEIRQRIRQRAKQYLSYKKAISKAEKEQEEAHQRYKEAYEKLDDVRTSFNLFEKDQRIYIDIEKDYTRKDYINELKKRYKELLAKRELITAIKSNKTIVDYKINYQDEHAVNVCLYIKGPSVAPTTESDISGGKNVPLLGDLCELGIQPFVCAKINVHFRSTENGDFKATSWNAPDDYFDDHRAMTMAEGALVSSHMYLCSCWGEWNLLIATQKTIEGTIKMISCAARNINYTEGAQMPCLSSVDVNKIRHWTYTTESGRRKTHHGYLASLLNKIPIEKIEKKMCDFGVRKCAKFYRACIVVSDFPGADLARKECSEDEDGNTLCKYDLKRRASCTDSQRCNCCYIGKYLTKRKKAEAKANENKEV